MLLVFVPLSKFIRSDNKNMCFRASTLSTFLYLSFWSWRVSRWEGKKKFIPVGRVQCGHESCTILNTPESRVFGEAELDRIRLASSEFRQFSLPPSNMSLDSCQSVVCSSVHSCFLHEGEMDFSPSRDPVGGLKKKIHASRCSPVNAGD